MASRKLTALPTATEVTTSDKIYIVDVSDTTESPQGTSKQATVDKIIPSGEWTPTISAITNSATVDVSSALYSRGGTVVDFSIGLDIQLDAGSVNTQFKISLPVASNFSNARQLIFSANLPTNLTFCVGSSSSADNLMVVDVIGTANGDTIEALQITGQYLIV